MRILSLKGAGVEVWGANKFELDLRDVEGVVSVWGPNGSGKTRLFELLGPATLYRDLPTRETNKVESIFLVDGWVELTVLLEKDRYTLRLERKASGMSATISKNGEIVKGCTGKVGAYDAEIERLFGPQAAFYASVYGAQGGEGSINDLPPNDRKSIITYYLGLDYIAKLHKSFADEAKELKKTAAEATQLQIDVSAAERAQAESRLVQEGLKASLEDVKEEFAKAKAACETLGDYEARVREYEAWQASEVRRKGTIDSAHAAVRQCEQRIDDVKSQLEGLSEETGPEPKKPAKPSDAYVVELRAVGHEVRERAKLESEQKAVGERAKEAKESASLIDKVPCGAEGEFAKCQLLARAVSARDSINELRSRWNGLGQSISGLAAQKELEALEEKDRKLRAEWQAYDKAVRAAQDTLSRRSALESRLAAAREEHKRLVAALKAAEAQKPLPRPPAPEGREDARKAVARRDAVEIELANVNNNLLREQGRYEQREEILVRSKEKLAKFGNVTAKQADLELLVKGLGPNGIRAMEMDVAGPDLTETANRILANCFGGRFTCQFVTTHQTKLGTIEEVFDVAIYDSEYPERTRYLGDLSGGEGVVVGEAVRSALAIFANQRLGSAFRTIWRDECGAALDTINKLPYVDMLRQVRREGDFHHAFYVSHDPDVSGAADYTIFVGPTGPSIKRIR